MKAVRLRKSFTKDYNKLSTRNQHAWAACIERFIGQPWHPKLRRHKLLGNYEGMDSLDVTFDLRALFVETEDRYNFYFIRNHNQLYS